MKIHIENKALTIKELLAILERTFTDNGITSIDSPSLYFGSSSPVIVAKLKKSEVGMESREQDGFSSIAF